MLNYDPDHPPTCGAVIRKEGDKETLCGEPASQVINMVDPDDRVTVKAIILVCDRHDRELEEGKKFVFVSQDGKDRVLVEYHSKEE